MSVVNVTVVNSDSPKEFEELVGGEGRAVFFRPERYRVSDLGPVLPTVKIRRGQDEIECEMYDVSQNGVAFVLPELAVFTPGDSIDEIAVSFDGADAYRGEGRVVSVRPAENTRIIGVSFVDSLMNIDDVIHLRAVKTWSPVESVGVSHVSQPWYVKGHSEFKANVGDMRLFLENAKKQYEDMERSLPWTVVNGEIESAAKTALMARIEKEFARDFVDIMGRIDHSLRSAKGDDWHRLKEFSIRQLHDFLMKAPLLHRTRYKPFGYPGDFLAMVHMYSEPFEGDGLFAKAVHMGSCASVPAQAVRARKNLIRDEIQRLVDLWKEDRPLKICAIAAGPAQETYEFLERAKSIDIPLEIILFDQDKLALSYAHKRIDRLVDVKFNDNVKVTFLHDSIKRLLIDPDIFGDIGPFDFIFAAGLFDYLRFKTAATLTHNLFLNLRSGGKVFIGNMDPANPSRWMFEHHLDWNLIYRTSEEMMEFGRVGVPSVRLDMTKEATGINPFLVVYKD